MSDVSLPLLTHAEKAAAEYAHKQYPFYNKTGSEMAGRSDGVIQAFIAGWQAREQARLTVTPEAVEAAARAYYTGGHGKEGFRVAIKAALEVLQPKPVTEERG